MQGDCSQKKYLLRTARGSNELEAVFRFRYEHFFHCFTEGYPGLDRVHSRLFEPHDLTSTHYCAFDNDGHPCAVSTATPATARDIPASWHEWLQLGGFVPRGSNGVVISTRLVIHPSHRHNGLFDLFYRFIMESYVKAGFEYTLHYCSPGLLCRYEALGHRPYGEAFVVPPGLLRVPMFMALRDIEYLSRLNPPLAELCATHVPAASTARGVNLLRLSCRQPNLLLLTPEERLDFIRTRVEPDSLPDPLDLLPVLEHASLLRLKAGLSHTTSTSGNFLFFVLSGAIKEPGTGRIAGPGAFVGTDSPPAPFTVVSDSLVLAFDQNLSREVPRTDTRLDTRSWWDALCLARDRMLPTQRPRATGSQEII